MKLIHISAAAVAVSLLPGMLCSCHSDGQQDPQAVEVRPDTAPEQNNDIYFTPQEAKKPEAEPAAEVKPQEPAPAPAPEVKPQEPVPAAEVKPQEPVPAPAPEVKPQEPQKTVPPCEHTVRTGDNLWKIAREYYGAGSKWKIIFEANRDKLKKAEYLEPGTVLTIPSEK